MTNKIYNDFNELFNKLNAAKELNKDQKIKTKTNELVKLVDNLKFKEKLKRNLFRLGVLLLIIGLIVLFWSNLRIYFIFLIRFIFIYLFSVYDFTVFYYERCMLKNPFYVKESRIKPQMCKYTCSEKTVDLFLKEFNPDTNLTRDSFKEIVYENNIPIIINNDISNGKIKSIKSIVNNFLKESPLINDDEFGLFEASNFDESLNPFLNRIFLNELKSYSAMWETFGKRSTKALKRLYSRPEYIPLSVEVGAQSWMLIANKFKHNLFIKVPIKQRLNLFNQLKGKSEIKLTSKPCKDVCNEQRFNITQGQTLVVSDMWKIEFLPLDSGENIVLFLIAG